jgi:hypothetical protein
MFHKFKFTLLRAFIVVKQNKSFFLNDLEKNCLNGVFVHDPSIEAAQPHEDP